MKRLLLGTALLLMTAPLAAQGFTFGGRYSNYSTDIDIDLVTVETGRETSVGLVGDYRNGQFVLRGQFDRDLEGGLSANFLPLNFGDYSRNRFELTAGWAPIPILDLEAGFRTEDVSVGGFQILGGSFLNDFEFDHQAIALGINAHTQTIRPIGWYGSARGYIGSADFQFEGIDVTSDTTGFKLETGFPIPVGVSGWEVTPGFEYEHLETDNYGLQFDTNRFFVTFAYTFGR